ncbi:MAG: diadenylate cyclase [Candidatus Thermoplasmatota archaeon]|nr:diadenylate cyclase [Candidatus Thermoplasmatota archaeon]MBS3789620.1 diadenylate cyclase [Candidatus Thermoplasmatota archaeon]
MTEFIDTVVRAKEGFDPSCVLLFTESEDLMEKISDQIEDEELTIFTKHKSLSSFLGRSNVQVRSIKNSPAVGLDVLDQVKDIVLSCAAEGLVDRDEKVMLVISTDVQTVLTFEMSDIGVVNLKEEVEDRIQLDVLEAAFNLGTKIAKEGNEGLPAGALFIMGDMNNVLSNTTDSVRNPLQGSVEEELNIKDKDNWNTIKEFSMLDGALVLDKFGNPVAAGRYVMFGDGFEREIEDGLGGRHLAASYISNRTEAVSLVVSSEGTIRVYKDGKKIYEVDVV